MIPQAIDSSDRTLQTKEDDPSPMMDPLSLLLSLTRVSDLAETDGIESTRTIDSSFSDEECDESLLQEIEAMGGDPFFLDATETTTIHPNSEHDLIPSTKASTSSYTSSLESKRRYATDGQGPSPKILSVKKIPVDDGSQQTWEWDGVVDEEAHLNLD